MEQTKKDYANQLLKIRTLSGLETASLGQKNWKAKGKTEITKRNIFHDMLTYTL